MNDTPPRPPPTATEHAILAELRSELDRLDDATHDLLMQRAEVVEKIGALAAKGRVPFRPGREADIIRRLLRRHRGALPRRVLPRIWRELFAATTAMQSSYVVTVCEREAADDFAACAREHFGALTPLQVHRTPAQAIRAVSGGTAIAAVLPMPHEDEPPAAAWWTALMQNDEPRIRVVARLPFWAPRPEGAPRAQALVVAAIPPDRSGRDRALLGLEVPVEMSRARLAAALATASFDPSAILLRRESGRPVAQALIDVTGYLDDADRRLPALAAALQGPHGAQRPVVLGGYAEPIEGDDA